jgi:thermostable 8-oxoguanine DNA glycosylase
LDEFFFCLLGGFSIPFELNKSAFSILKEKGYFDSQLPWEEEGKISQELSKELRTPQFLPRRLDGGLRSYRFPNKKALIIASAGRWLKNGCAFKLSCLFEGNDDSKGKRNVLLQCPGFGYKSASWFLRNIGMGDNLAILDVHIFNTLQEFRIIPVELDISSDYLEIEDIYCCVCDQIGADPQIMDLIVWSWKRGDYVNGEQNVL